MSVAVVLPAYNEEATIAGTIEAFFRELPDAFIVVVDNKSTDRTALLAQETFAGLGARGAVLTELRQGKGNAVRRAFLDIDADIFVLCDADMTYPAQSVHQLIAPIVSGEADMTVGDRRSGGQYASENKRRFHSFGNELVRRLVNALFRANLTDVMSGYRAFNVGFVRDYPILVGGFQIETDMTLHALDRRYRIREIPIDYQDRPPGSHSKLSTFRDGALVLFAIFQIVSYHKPLLLFGTLSALFAVGGVVVALPVFEDWIQYRYIYHVPLAILAAALEAVAMTALGIGLVLNAVNHHFKILFERGQVRRYRRSGG
jgi:glycosyltransferase involved in cell wall biosynthesis